MVSGSISLTDHVVHFDVKCFFFTVNLHDHGYNANFSKEVNYINEAGGVEFAFLKLHTDFSTKYTTLPRF